MSAEHRVLIEQEMARGTRISIIAIIDQLVMYAFSLRASDVHLDPTRRGVCVRMRVDGMLHEAFVLPLTIHAEIISRLKIMASLRTDEHHTPQDGRFRLPIAEVLLDVRISIIPTYYGENAVLRLLIQKEEYHTLETLGFNQSNLQRVRNAMQKPYGMILVTGPTGSGKTTTLYTILKMLNTPESAIVTIEDPIEYAIDGVEQIQANSRTGLSFAQGLRSILRQDPNIIMVGEIRDTETAGIAVNVALTGHLLLSTLHTNDPSTSLPRLLDMKIEPYLVASTVTIVIGQRLIRTICSNCKISYFLEDSVMESFSYTFPDEYLYPDTEWYRGTGCTECNNTGYKGRIALHEVLSVSEPIRNAIVNKASAREIKQLALQDGMVSMLEDGLHKAHAGLTTLEEVLRVTYE